MFTKQQVLDSFESTQKLPKEEMTEQFALLLKKQEAALSFVVANVEQYQLSGNTKNAAAELIFYIFKLYESKGLELALEEKYIADALISMDVDAKEIEKDLGGLSEEDIQVLNEAIESGNSDKLEGKPKAILEAIQKKKQKVSQPYLLEVVSSYVASDELIIEKEKSFVFSIAETLIEAIQAHAKEHLTQV